MMESQLTMFVSGEVDSVRQAVVDAQRQGQTVGLVPTMGALHAGHLSLIRAARRECEVVAVTVFVNPTQFGPGEDFEAYPRPLEKDLEACLREAVDIVFAPEVETMYPPDGVTTVQVEKLTAGLCGAHRPGHFAGVTTVVAKLFNILPADAAYFGEKDYQQLVVIRQMARDLNLPIRIVGCPTVREEDGLALSSRNAYLTRTQRRLARSLSQALFAARKRVAEGERRVATLVAEMRASIEAAEPAQLDYLEIVDPMTLESLTSVKRGARACLAVRIGKCRLIDNLALDAPEP